MGLKKNKNILFRLIIKKMSEENQEIKQEGKTFFENYVINEELPFIDRFDDERLSLKKEILNGIYDYGFDRPSPIQRIAIKPISEGKDLVMQSHSGSGKTATFVTGMLQKIDFSDPTTQAVIISNTKDLSDQIYEVFTGLSKYCNLTSSLCCGGDLSNKYMSSDIQSQVVIGTPGRVCDLIQKGILNSRDIKLFIVDEADEVLSSGFRKQLKYIIGSLTKECQIVLSSATIPQEMNMIVKTVLREGYTSILVKNEELTLDEIKQYYVALEDFQKMEVLLDIYRNISIGQCIVYCNRKQKADEIRDFLQDNGYTVGVNHGDLMVSERKEIMDQFRIGKVRILITTDLLARGIDIQQISLVINYDMPKYTQTYIHRIGRSGRFGREGVAINFVTRREKNILGFIERTFKTHINHLPQDLKKII